MHYIILVEFHIKEKYKDIFKSKYYLVCKYYDEGYIEYNILREDTFVQNVKRNKAICDNFELKCNNYIDNISNVITMDMNCILFSLGQIFFKLIHGIKRSWEMKRNLIYKGKHLRLQWT